MGPAKQGGQQVKAKRSFAQRSELEARVRTLIEDLREAVRRRDPGAVDAILRLAAGAKTLIEEHWAITDDANAERAQDDDAEDRADDDPAA